MRSDSAPLPITVRLDPAATPGALVQALAELVLARVRRQRQAEPRGGDKPVSVKGEREKA